MHPGVGQLERTSFQSPEETSSVQKDRVKCEPSLVFRWSFGTALLLLNLRPHQLCDKSSNVALLLGNLGSVHEAAGSGWLPPPRNLATAVERPPGPGQAQSPAPQAESDTTDLLAETTVEYPTSKKQARRSVAPACLRYKTTLTLPYVHNGTTSPGMRPVPPRSTPWPRDH